MEPLKSTIKDLFTSKKEIFGSKVILSGWIRNIRTQKNLIFIDFNDGSYFKNVQLVAESGDTDAFDQISKASNGSAIIVEGEVVEAFSGKQPVC